MKNKIFGALAALLLVSSAGAFDGGVTFDQKGSVSGILDQVRSANPGAEIIPMPGNSKAAKKWTVMVFVNAKNNLESYGLSDVNEMEVTGSDDNINIVAELGRINGYSTADGDWKGGRRYLVQKDADTSKITSPVLMELPKADMGDWNHLVEFTKWSMANFPAQHYVLVVWNHGAGWNKDVVFEAQRGISYDDETGNHITTPQLRQAMAQIGKIDIFAMDACLMQMAEVGYEIKDYTDYVVASEETEPGDGYTYNTWLSPLAAKSDMAAGELSKAMVDSYTDHYQAINQGATQSSVKTASFGKLVQLLDGWTAEVMAANDLVNVKNARTKAQAFYYATNKDLYHFIKLVSDATASPAVSAKGKELMDFLKTDLIFYNRAAGARYANSFGLAVYLPNAYTAAYDSLMWTKDSKWDDFLKWIK
ncbi:MAG: clostripain-related cysteine peptidase [Elusimicrobiota bacterium]